MASTSATLRLLPLLALCVSTVSGYPSRPLLSRADTDDDLTYAALGCFVDEGSRILPSRIISTHDMTAAKCAINCAGYDFFGTQWSSECYCGNNRPTNPAPASDCNMACSGDPNENCGGGMRLNVYELEAECEDPPTSSISGFEYKGCYSDNVAQRVLAGKTVTESDMTLEKCAATCSVGGYTWFGVEYGSECFCGTTLDAASIKQAEGECDMACSGDASQKCGGPNRLNVYHIPPETPGSGTGSNLETIGDFHYVSCWTDKVDDRSLKAVDWRTDDMTLEKCAERCKDYSYFGLEYSRECYCGDDLLGEAAPEKDCGILCVGASTQWCGGPDRLNLYAKAAASATSTSEIATSTAEPGIQTSSTVEPDSTSTPEPVSSTLELESSTVEPIPYTTTTSEVESSTSSTLNTSSLPSSTTTTPTSTTSQGPNLTTITSCPPIPTYNGTPELCFAKLPAGCQRLTSSFNSRSLATMVASCRARMTAYGFTASPAAVACFPTSPIPQVPAATAASATASAVFACLNQPAASLLCQSDSNCVTNTYTVGQVPAPTPVVGVDVLQGSGGFESGNMNDWAVSGAGLAVVETSVTDEFSRSGRYSLRAFYNNKNGGSISIQKTAKVIPDQTYEYKFWFWHTNSAATTSLYQYIYGADIFSTPFTEAQLSNTAAGVWRTRSITFVATGSWVQLTIQTGGNVGSGGTNTIYIDDLTLTRLSA
ncbi:WSC domain-containing protein [Podospora australis]|uniref:WSC domain-containing protein n=1 Tax=Podospora australis TaxID=1536484 RepID=A0AAN6WN41_9PEZI|nr:WSC domain-containing protein [Podospora australis]